MRGTRIHETHSRGRMLAKSALGATALATALMTAFTPAHAWEGKILGAGNANAIEESYIVVLEGNPSITSTAESLTAEYGGEVTHTYGTAIEGYAATMAQEDARELAADPAVDYVEANKRVHAYGTQTDPPSWGLDRIDQPSLPLDDSYTYPETSSDVHAYIIDTGIRVSHNDFGGRASWGVNTADDINRDCNGHGTHVAGTVGGSQYGVAKSVRLVAVKVLGCDGSGSTAGVVDGIDWVTRNAGEPAVANMSLGGSVSRTLDNAVANSIESGITYAVAAGNADSDACDNSPARVPEAVTVGSTTRNDSRSYFSNYGSCLDIFAPGSNITSAWNGSDSDSNTISGTSMASPHVAGAAALLVGAHPSWSPARIRDELVSQASTGVISDVGAGSPNRLLQVATTDSEPPDDDPPNEPPESGCADHEQVFTGSVSDGGVSYEPDGSYFYAEAGTHTACLDGPDGTDFDLYLQKWNGWTWVDVASGTTPGPDETLTHTGSAGYYSYQIHAYSGSGDYTLGFDAP